MVQAGVKEGRKKLEHLNSVGNNVGVHVFNTSETEAEAPVETCAPISDALTHEGLPVDVEHIRTTIHFHITK